MLRLERHWCRFLLWSALLACCGGCMTGGKSLFTVSGSGWQVQQGQALWCPRRGYPELGGDLLVARHEDGRCYLEFAKTPMVLVSVQTTPTRWRVLFPPRHIGFKGGGQPSLRYSCWAFLPAALGGKPLPPALRYEPKADGGWRLVNTRSGETMEGFLSP